MPKVNNQTLNNIIVNKKKEEKRKKAKFDKETQREHTIAWTTYYRRNIHRFATEYLGIKLHFFQVCMLYLMSRCNVVMYIMSRGSSKTFLTGVYCICIALLYPNSEILVTSYTLNQASLIIRDKIDKELCGELALSPVLKYLKDNKYIVFNYVKDKATCDLTNGSKIFSAVCGEESRGLRSTMVIIDEARLVKKKDVDGIIVQTLRPRRTPYTQEKKYAEFFEEPQQIYLSSAKQKSNWLYRFMIKTVNNFYHHNYLDENDKLSYGFLAADIYTSVASGIKTEAQMLNDRENTDELSFEMEALNLWLGENENSLFTYEAFNQQQVLSSGFVPSEHYESFPPRDKNNKYRVLAMDIAVASGRENDNTVFVLGYYDEKENKRKVEYIRAYNGLNSLNQVVMAKRLFYDYGCDYFVVDTKGVGNVMYDMLTVKTFDEDRMEEYPAWTIVEDNMLQISSEKVLTDKAIRTIDKDAVPVIIPIAGTPEINSNVHLSMRKNLNDHKIEFLKDESEAEILLAEDEGWLFKSPEERANILIAYTETRLMVYESISLQQKMTSAGIAVVEDRSATKDRYMATGYFNYFCDKLETKLAREAQGDEGMLDDMQLVF